MVQHFKGGSALIEQWPQNKETMLFLEVTLRISQHYGSDHIGFHQAAAMIAAPALPDRSERHASYVRPVWRSFTTPVLPVVCA
ncbi:hypothetical protein [Chromobacterium paludis]|nr:hypothetical protein [Chromobacterium paludis]